MNYVGAIDAGGTSWRCAVVDDRRKILARAAFATTSPQETLGKASAFFMDQVAKGFALKHVGIACFGPLCTTPSAHNWGHILATPKPGWSNTDVVGGLARGLEFTISIELDVIAAALAERAWGGGRGLDDFAYVTVGTGIGAGIILGGSPISGASHPEAGHMRVPKLSRDKDFSGICPFHGDCVEGLASATALKARWHMDPVALADDHPAWDIEAHYLAHLAANLVLTTAVRRVIFGGGVSMRAGLIDLVARQTKDLVGPYGLAAQGEAGFEVVPAGLGLESGLLGAVWLAQKARASASQ